MDSFYLFLIALILYNTMRKLIILIFCILLKFISFAQNQDINKTLGVVAYEAASWSSIEVNKNTTFVQSVRQSYSGLISEESIIFKLDSNCNIIDSLNLLSYHKNGKYYYLWSFIRFNNKIIGNGHSEDSITHKKQLWISEFNDNLTIKRDTLLGNEDTLINFFISRLLVTSQNNIMASITYIPTTTPTDTFNTLLLLLDSNFCIIKKNSIYTNFYYAGHSVVEMSSNNSYHIITANDITKINQSDLSFISNLWERNNNGYWGDFGASAIADSAYLEPMETSYMDYSTIPFTVIDNFFLHIRDKNGNTKDSIRIGNLQKNYKKASTNCFCYNTTDSIFIAGYNLPSGSDPYTNVNNNIFLRNISLNGNLNWQKYYGNNNQFIVENIEKTSDGGCFMVGEIWDWQNGYPQYWNDLFFLKVDRYGNITGTSGVKENIKQSEILVYPNPAKDIINFEMGMYEGYKLTIVNSMGQTVKQQDVTSGKNSIDINSFTKGIYFYSLVNNKGKVISGKFVKE